MANNGINGQGLNGINGNPALQINGANHLAPAGPPPQNAQEAPAPAQMAGHEQAEVAPAHLVPEPLLAQELGPEPAPGNAPEPAQEPAPEIAPEAAPGVAAMPIANDDTDDSPLKGSLRGLEHILFPGGEDNA